MTYFSFTLSMVFEEGVQFVSANKNEFDLIYFKIKTKHFYKFKKISRIKKDLSYSVTLIHSKLNGKQQSKEWSRKIKQKTNSNKKKKIWLINKKIFLVKANMKEKSIKLNYFLQICERKSNMKNSLFAMRKNLIQKKIKIQKFKVLFKFSQQRKIKSNQIKFHRSILCFQIKVQNKIKAKILNQNKENVIELQIKLKIQSIFWCFNKMVFFTQYSLLLIKYNKEK
ncbi:hypothetical protein ABPG74_005053 [Tetrahymena malaccensis]